jgi:hypothetical protein
MFGGMKRSGLHASELAPRYKPRQQGRNLQIALDPQD